MESNDRPSISSPVLNDDSSDEWSYGDSFESSSSKERAADEINLEVHGRHFTPRVHSNETIGSAPDPNEDLFGNDDDDNENRHNNDWDEDLAFLAGTGDRKENLANALENVMRVCNIDTRPRFTTLCQAQSSSTCSERSFARQSSVISPIPGTSYGSKLWVYPNDRIQTTQCPAVRNVTSAQLTGGSLVQEQRQMNVRNSVIKPVPLPTPSVDKPVNTESLRMAGYQRIPTVTPVDNIAHDESAHHRLIPYVVTSPLQGNESRMQHQEWQQYEFAERSTHSPAIHENDLHQPSGRLSQTPSRAKSSTYWNITPIDHRPYTPTALLAKARCSKTPIDSDVRETSSTPKIAQPKDRTTVPSTPETGIQESKPPSPLHIQDRDDVSDTISEISLPTEDIIPHYDGPDGNEAGTHCIQESRPICNTESWEEKKWVRLRRIRRRIQSGWSAFKRSLQCERSKL